MNVPEPSKAAAKESGGMSLLEKSMRMPILSYFLVVGIALFGGLVLVSSELESKPLPVSQRIGLPAPFKAPPENTQSPTNDSDDIIP